MFNLFSKNQEPEDRTPSEEEKQKIIQKYKERWKKEDELYNRILENEKNLARALQMIVHRIDLATDSSFLLKIGTLESRIEKTFPESND